MLFTNIIGVSLFYNLCTNVRSHFVFQMPITFIVATVGCHMQKLALYDQYVSRPRMSGKTRKVPLMREWIEESVYVFSMIVVQTSAFFFHV